MDQLIEIVKISRPGFWPTHIWFYLLPFGKRDMFGDFEFWLGAFYVCFPLSLLLYGWNDIGDWETDQVNPRKDSWLFGGRPDPAMRRRLPWIIGLVQIPFVVSFCWIAGPKMLIFFLGVVVASAAYNTAVFKNMFILDLICQTGYLLIFVLASWLCSVEQLNVPAIVFGGLFAMQSHLFGQLMDISQDTLAGRRSTAITLGVFRSKLTLASIMLVESAIAFSFFNGSLVGVFMLLGAAFFLLDAFRGPDQYPLSFVRWFFIGWNLVVIATIHFIWHHGVFILSD